MIMNKQSLAVSNHELSSNPKINRDLLIYNQFHKNANLPYLECAKNNSKKDIKKQQNVNTYQFLRPQKAVLGINPIVTNNSFNNNHSTPIPKNNSFTQEFKNDKLPQNIYRNFSSSTRISKKTYSNVDMNLRNQYK